MSLVQATEGATLNGSLAYTKDEKKFREAFHGSCFDPAVYRSFPGLLSGKQVIQGMKSMIPVDMAADFPWESLRMDDGMVARLQIYWVYSHMKGVKPGPQGP